MLGRLIRIEICGMKNIEQPVSLQLLNSTVTKTANANKSNVKAVYGPNGAGKSAIITAVMVYKSLVEQQAYLANVTNKSILAKLINKKTKEFYVKLEFEFNDDTEINVYSHYIHLRMDKESVYIDCEEIMKLKGKSTNAEWIPCISFCDGKVVNHFGVENDLEIELQRACESMASTSSIVSALASETQIRKIVNMVAKKDPQLDASIEYPTFECLLETASFVAQISTFLDDPDRHQPSGRDYKKLLLMFNNKDSVNIDDLLLIEDIVLKKDYPKYEQQVNKLEYFIRIFKPELRRINIKKKLDGNYYHVSKEFEYDGYSIDGGYESTGIKKLSELYTFIDKAVNGGVVFIDEIDSNINEIILDKLIEYFIEYGKGQLVFTTHSINQMKVLKGEKYSIDFINHAGTQVPWIKNGNYSPQSQYANGMIPGIPFNVDTFDFIKCFSRE